jgi:hypothetical protein
MERLAAKLEHTKRLPETVAAVSELTHRYDCEQHSCGTVLETRNHAALIRLTIWANTPRVVDRALSARPAIRPACYSKIGIVAPSGCDQGATEDRMSCHDKTL